MITTPTTQASAKKTPRASSTSTTQFVNAPPRRVAVHLPRAGLQPAGVRMSRRGGASHPPPQEAREDEAADPRHDGGDDRDRVAEGAMEPLGEAEQDEHE